MSQPRRTIEHLLQHGILPITQADAAATHLEVYPNKRTWLAFFDKAFLVIGAVALALSLVFFIAYNWQNMGKMGKFTLVEGALLITIALYVGLFFRQRFLLIRQLLLLIASVITGSLLALFGQVYQTGADTWQLFFAWALLITPWVMIARFPALWLLWLGLINACLLLYFDVTGLMFIHNGWQSHFQVVVLALVNLVALYGWLSIFDHQRHHSPSTAVDASDNNTATSISPEPTKSSLHWSIYVVGLLSTYFITYLAITTVFDDWSILVTLSSVVLWLGWCGFMLWRFYQRRVDLLMLTYLALSVIVVVMFWVGKWVLEGSEAGGFLVLALLLIGMSSMAVIWLRKVACLDSAHKPHMTNGGADDE
ncbi:DUF2157 domain-containing protein [Psychrobacter vallis]|uniref:DUF2157 domain-containing protein n=1 Tax=Psychrobacter vallis TaxID=248451 RepID=UPI001919247D|nr:DUF2157 domain-containing protein [Psychrobacter vallis]